MKVPARVFYNDKYTLVVMSRDNMGISMCGPGDKFNLKKGIKVAIVRAVTRAYNIQSLPEKVVLENSRIFYYDIDRILRLASLVMGYVAYSISMCGKSRYWRGLEIFSRFLPIQVKEDNEQIGVLTVDKENNHIRFETL